MTIGLCSWPVFYFVVKKFYLYLTTRKWEIDALFFDDYRGKSKEQPSNNDNWMKTVNKCSFFLPWIQNEQGILHSLKNFANVIYSNDSSGAHTKRQLKYKENLIYHLNTRLVIPSADASQVYSILECSSWQQKGAKMYHLFEE